MIHIHVDNLYLRKFKRFSNELIKYLSQEKKKTKDNNKREAILWTDLHKQKIRQNNFPPPKNAGKRTLKIA